MLQLAILFLVAGLACLLLGFTAIAGTMFPVARAIAGLCFILFAVFLYMGRAGVKNTVK